jgi:hypothetical protein
MAAVPAALEQKNYEQKETKEAKIETIRAEKLLRWTLL